jgi:hypothetical protein
MNNEILTIKNIVSAEKSCFFINYAAGAIDNNITFFSVSSVPLW